VPQTTGDQEPITISPQLVLFQDRRVHLQVRDGGRRDAIPTDCILAVSLARNATRKAWLQRTWGIALIKFNRRFFQKCMCR